MSSIKDALGTAITVGGVGGAFTLAATTALNPMVPVCVAAASCTIGDDMRESAPVVPQNG